MGSKRAVADGLVEALLDPRVVDALVKALGVKISDIVEARLETRLKEIRDVVHELKDENSRVKKIVSQLEADNKALSAKIETLDAYSKADNLIITGLPNSSLAEAVSVHQSESVTVRRGSRVTTSTVIAMESNEASELAVVQFVNDKLNIPLTREDISIAHRLPRRINDATPAPMIVRFTSRRARNAVYRARKSLAQSRSSVFINEHLTANRAALFREARLLVKNKKLQGAWTSNGAVYIRLSDLPDSRPLLVSSLSDLPRG